MQRNEVEAIFQERKEKLLQGITPSTNPIAIIMGGQPACGKSFLLEIAKSDNIDKKFLSINGDLYREFHPEKAKLNSNHREVNRQYYPTEQLRQSNAIKKNDSTHKA